MMKGRWARCPRAKRPVDQKPNTGTGNDNTEYHYGQKERNMPTIQLNRERGFRWYDAYINDMGGSEHRHAWVYAKNAKKAAVYLWKESDSLVDTVCVKKADSTDNHFSPCEYEVISAFTEWEKSASRKELEELDAFVNMFQ